MMGTNKKNKRMREMQTSRWRWKRRRKMWEKMRSEGSNVNNLCACLENHIYRFTFLLSSSSAAAAAAESGSTSHASGRH